MKKLFEPDGIAIAGASTNPTKAGYVALRNMKEKEYPGKVYPINPNETEILGYKCYKALSEIEGNVDLVVLIMPARLIYDIMDDFDKRMEEKHDVKYIVCAAADYAETQTEEGVRRQARLMQSAEKYGVRVIGPNCIGVIDAVLMEGAGRVFPVLYNKFISIGNMADIDFVDLLEYLENDDTTKVIGMYMEGYRDGRKLAETLRRITAKKPVVILKVGRSEKGSKAANSHTGSMAGADNVYDAMFKQYGVIRVDTIDELIDTMQALDALPLPKGKNHFLYSQAGGPGIYCTDAIAAAKNLETPLVSEETKERLRASQLPMANICSPEGYADITASASVANHVDGLRIVLEDDAVDSVTFITVVPTFLPQIELANALVEMEKSIPEDRKKPVYYCVMAGAYTAPARKIMEENGLCTFNTPDKAVKAADNMTRYALYRARKAGEE